MKIVVALFALCLASPAFAFDPTGTGYVHSVCPTKFQDRFGNTLMKRCVKTTFNPVGLRLDIGAPDAIGISLVGRPLKFAQVELGGTTTLVGGGVRTGLSVFLPWYISPGINVEYGHQWAGNINKLVVMFGGNDPKISLLNHVEYDYMNLHGTLGFGHPNWFMFKIHAGYSYIWGSTNGLEAYLQNKTNQPLMITEAYAKIWTPSAKIVFQIYF